MMNEKHIQLLHEYRERSPEDVKLDMVASASKISLTSHECDPRDTQME